MPSTIRRWLIVTFFDFLIVLSVLFTARYFVPLPKWYYLVLVAFVWAFIGLLSSKLKFGDYKRMRYAIMSITTIDVLVCSFIILIYHWILPEREFHWTHIAIPLTILLLEIIMYFIFRKMVLRKIPFFYEVAVPLPSCEPGWDRSVKYESSQTPKDLSTIIEGIRYLKVHDAYEWINDNMDKFSKETCFINTTNPKDIYPYSVKNPELIVVRNSFSTIRHLNTYLANINMVLPVGGYVAGHCTTSGLKREEILKSNPAGIRHIFAIEDFLWHRVAPRLAATKWIYFGITNGKKRVFSRVEMLGRMCMAGFEIVDDDVRNGEFFVTAKKVGPPLASKPNTGLLIRLRRIGKNKEIIGVYKFRTMHSYSEFLQGYVYQHGGLQAGGKMDRDYRVTSIGHFLRKTWMDELPMLINWVKGDLKLVGVRPLSEHYFKLYTPEMQEMRVRTKPGLIPPFYAEKTIPVTLEDVQANEKRYLEQYFERPFATDWKYFWGAMKNILFKGAKSK